MVMLTKEMLTKTFSNYREKQKMNLKDFQPFLSYEVMLPGESNLFQTTVVTIRDSRAEL